MKISKDNIIFALLGIILGMFIAVFAGVVLYKVVKGSSQPARYAQLIKQTESPAKAVKALTSFYLSFEKTSDLDVFQGDAAALEISQAHASHGKHSLLARINPGSDFPGLLWEVYGNDVINWARAKDFHFDVYNNSEDTVNLNVKFKSGRDYPKKTYSYPVSLEPLKMNSISIPIESIASACDITQMSYVKLFVQSPQKEIALYFDNIGIKQGTKADEVTDTASTAVSPVASPIVALKEKEEIFAASSLDRIFQDGKTLVAPSFTQEVNLSLAKNEYESFQIVISNGKDELRDVRLEIKLDKNNIQSSWRKVGYVPTKKPYYPVKFVGLWPDPLIPEDKVTIKPGLTQPLWVTVYASQGTAAGIYKGTIQVITGTTILKELPISVKVENFTLPLESHLKTAFDFYSHITSLRYPQKEKESKETYTSRIAEINEKFIINMLKHRMNPILNIDPASQESLGKADNYRKYGLNNFSIGKKGGTFDNNWPSTDDEIEKLLPVYRGYGETLKLNNMLQNTYIYTWDESKMNDPQVAKICSMIHRAYPGLKNMVCYHGFWDPVKNPGWGKDIDIWCFGIGDYNESKVKTLLDQGMEMWMYISGPSGTGDPNLAIDFDSMDYRIIPWLCWKYNLKGFLYWCVNWWTLVDPYVNASNTKWEQNGNGLLFYPGENGPVDSLRAEIYRDGMEDYEYLYLLKQKTDALSAKAITPKTKLLLEEARNLLTIDKTIAGSMRNFTKSTKVLTQRRQKIAETIETLEKTLKNE